jgi:hypothetical protein
MVITVYSPYRNRNRIDPWRCLYGYGYGTRITVTVPPYIRVRWGALLKLERDVGAEDNKAFLEQQKNLELQIESLQ